MPRLEAWQTRCSCGRPMARQSAVCLRCRKKQIKEDARPWRCSLCGVEGEDLFYPCHKYRCRECHREDARKRSAELYARDPELCKKRMRRYYEAHVEDFRRRSLDHYYRNREAILAKQKAAWRKKRRRSSDA